MRADQSAYHPKKPPSKNITRIMYTSDDASDRSDDPDDDSAKYESLISRESHESYEKCCCEESVTRRKRVIEWMWDERCYSSRYCLRIWSPLRDTEIQDGIYEKCQNDREKYLECRNLIMIIFFSYTVKPESYKYECSIYYDHLRRDPEKSYIFL